MTPARHNFSFQRGNTEHIAFRVLHDDRTPMDVSDSQFTLYVLDSSGRRIFTRDAIIIGHTVTWHFAASDTAMLPPGQACRYEIVRIKADVRETWIEGKITGRGSIPDGVLT